MIGLTPKQQECLSFVEEFFAVRGFAPSFNEIQHGLNLKSRSGVHRLIEALVERGFIRRLPNRARAMEIVGGRTVALKNEIYIELAKHAREQGISLEVAANEILRECMGLAA